MLLPWDNDIIAGVSERHLDIFQPIGLTLGNTSILNSTELLRHRQFFADSLGIKLNCLKFQHQVHGDAVVLVDNDTLPSESDGMISNQHSIMLCVLVADCCGILLYDQQNQAIGALHSGWRGTHLNIAAKGVLAMKQHFGTNSEQLLAFLSPCASGEKYVVRQEVAELFPTASKQISDDHYLFDNRMRIKQQLRELGLVEEKITISNECSILNTNFHSFRRDKEQSGRTAVFIGLK